MILILCIIDEIHILSESTSNIEALLKSSTPIFDDIYTHGDDICGIEHVLKESTMSVHVVRFSITAPKIKKLSTSCKLLDYILLE